VCTPPLRIRALPPSFELAWLAWLDLGDGATTIPPGDGATPLDNDEREEGATVEARVEGGATLAGGAGVDGGAGVSRPAIRARTLCFLSSGVSAPRPPTSGLGVALSGGRDATQEAEAGAAGADGVLVTRGVLMRLALPFTTPRADPAPPAAPPPPPTPTPTPPPLPLAAAVAAPPRCADLARDSS
jgi:hypothetical protein